MELVYLYIEKYRNFNKAQFNFSEKIHLHFDEENMKLNDVPMKNYVPEGFWGENIGSLMMIVGNNGSGKTSLMQYIISLCQSFVGRDNRPGCGIIVFREKECLYYYEYSDSGNEGISRIQAKIHHDKYFIFKILSLEKAKEMFSTLKLIYLTNALSHYDHQRNQKMRCGRFDFLYDCSVGGLIYSDAKLDINYEQRRHNVEFPELETYFTYEQYKQIKFVFDENQYRILKELEDKGYPVPRPEKLYISLLLDDQLRFMFYEEEYETEKLIQLDERLFPREYGKIKKHMEKFRKARLPQIKLSQEEHNECASLLLRYEFCRCCIWGMVRSMIRRFYHRQKLLFWKALTEWIAATDEKQSEFCQVSERIWEICEEIVKKEPLGEESGWSEFKEKCKSHYKVFLEYIESQSSLGDHLLFERPAEEFFIKGGDISRLSLSVSTQDADWFTDFLKKYRYIANPDYFMNFQWGLSSGESNLLSTFASFYYIFGRDYTNDKNGDYAVYNREQNGDDIKCNTMILLADEVDLTYHPEWQREYISLLTAFLVRIYPPSCCENIQIILSTHSPILLGDVPQQNVIYLKFVPGQGCVTEDNTAHLGTFGQNIHLLFKKGFFLERGTMGRFAHNKIYETMKHLQDLDELVKTAIKEADIEKHREEYGILLEKYMQYVELVAEPILKKKLLLQGERIREKLFGEKQVELQYLSDESLEKQIELLQKEMDRRKNDKDSNL